MNIYLSKTGEVWIGPRESDGNFHYAQLRATEKSNTPGKKANGEETDQQASFVMARSYADPEWIDITDQVLDTILEKTCSMGVRCDPVLEKSE